jgi:uncharacterized protein (DUF2141 family)
LKPSVKILIGFLLAVSFIQMTAQSLNIKIENIRDTTGIIFLAFFRDDGSFHEGKPFMVKKVSKESMVNGSLSVSLCIEAGHYGIALLDDENSDDRMEYNWLGIPREGFGFSDFYARGLRRPAFSDFDFDVKDSTKNIRIVIRYI